MSIFRNIKEIKRPVNRILSLVPSMTQSLLDLGLGSKLVGITDYCPTDPRLPAEILRVGGPKDPDIHKIKFLNPDLIIANQEENTRECVEQLSNLFQFWLTFPRTVRQSLQDLYDLISIFPIEYPYRMVQLLEISLEIVESAKENHQPTRYFCPIWQGIESSSGTHWWMTFNDDAYPADVLRLFGGVNIFQSRIRRYPFLLSDLGLTAQEDAGSRDVRYPCVTANEVLALEPEIILLPSEPFSYMNDHLPEFYRVFAGTPAVTNGRVYPIEGQLIMWHGTALGKALLELPSYFA